MKLHELANWSIYTRKKGHTKNSILLENEQRPIFPGANAKMRQQIKNCSLDDRIKGATRKKTENQNDCCNLNSMIVVMYQQ